VEASTFELEASKTLIAKLQAASLKHQETVSCLNEELESSRRNANEELRMLKMEAQNSTDAAALRRQKSLNDP